MVASESIDTSILHHAFILIFIALWTVISLYVTILMAILSYFTRFTWRGRMPAAGILDWKRSKNWRPILHSSKSPETPCKSFWELIINIERKKYQRGPTPWPRGWWARPTPLGAPLPRGPPGRPPVPIFCYMKSFTLENIISKLTGRNSAATRWNLGGTNVGLRWSYSAGVTSLREGEIITIVITNDPLIGRGSISINIFTSTISSQTLVHLLYPIFSSKPQIGTCGLLVVLITPCSWCLLVYLVEDHMFRSFMHINTPLIMNMNMICE